MTSFLVHGCRYRVMACVIVLLAGCASPPVSRSGNETLYVARDYVADGAFTSGIEGPASGPGGALYVVNFAREGSIGRVTESADGRGQTELFVQLPEGSTGNGLRFDRDGYLYVADYTGHAILRIDTLSAAVSRFASLQGAHQPNDIALAPDGSWYASDPDWKQGSGQIWRILPSGKASLVETGMGTTNGIEVSPDGKHLYVNESVQRRIWAYDLDEQGLPRNKRLLIQFAEHGLDGMRCDASGNLYVARYDAGRVAVVSPGGRLLREIELKGRKPSNVAFGGKDGRTLYVTLQDRGAIEAFRTDTPGREFGK